MSREEGAVRERIAQLGARIAECPERLRDEPSGELLYHAVRGIDAAYSEALVRELVERRDPVLRAEAVRITRAGLRAAVLAPGLARRLLVEILDTDDAATRDALDELAEPWAALEPLPRDRLARLLTGGAAEAVVRTAARHGHADLLREVAADPERPPRLRRAALEALGGLARREDVPGLVSLATTDPLLLAGPVFRCLRGLHRRGHFPAETDVPGLVALALADHTVPADEVATVLFTCRRALLRELATPPGARDWPRRLDLLTALAAQGTGDLPIGDAVTRAMREAPDPEPFLRALRVLRHTPAEQNVLDVLPRSPEAALEALEAVGGERAAATLSTGLGLDGDAPIADHLRPVRDQALGLVWQLTEDPDRRRAILPRLNPRDLPPRVAAGLGGPEGSELAVLRAAVRPGEPATMACTLARHGDRSTIPAIADLLMRVVSDLAAGWTSGEITVEPDVPPLVRDEIRGLGERLHRAGSFHPRDLLDAPRPDAAGRALLTGMLLDLLERPDVTAAEQMVLLRSLQETPDPRIRARAHPLLRHRDRHVRKHAIDLLARNGGADALSASLVPLTTAPDVQTVRQAVAALGRARATWAAEAVAACLDHPNMNIKKTAAAALSQAGGPAAVPKLLYWLGAHDNPGLREAIVAALKSVLGDTFAATVTAAADRADDTRTRDLLLTAIPAPKDEPGPDPDVKALTDLGWDPGPGRRLVRRTDLDPAELRDLRPMLDRWLDLAADAATLRFALRLCPAPWSDHELRGFARSARTLVAGLADLTGDDRERLVAALEAALPRLPEDRAAEVAERLRAAPLGGRDLLVLLRRCGALRSRADLDRALSTAPWQDLEAVLREALGAAPLPDADPRWREALRAAVATPADLRRFRAADHSAGSRDRLDALIRVYPEADAEARAVLLDWMTALQPVDAPPWTVAETARHAPEPRAVHPGDLDQPRSAAQRARLLAMLDDPNPDRRATAARALTDWPEPEIRRSLLRAHLDGRVDLTPTPALARHLSTLSQDELDAASRVRTAGVVARLDPLHAARFAPLLLGWWPQGTPDLHKAITAALNRAAREPLADLLAEAEGEAFTVLLERLSGGALLSTPALRKALQRAHDTGHGRLAERITLVEGPIRAPGADRRDAATLTAMRARTRPPAAQAPTREDLFHTARTGTAQEIRRALSALAEDHPGPELAALLVEAVGHPERRVRLHAHRLARAHLDRPAYLEQTARLLDDPAPDVVRSAVRTLSHARWQPLIPTLVDLLLHQDPALRRAAAEGLAGFGTQALPALRHAEGRARPDRRPHYTGVIEEIVEAAG